MQDSTKQALAPTAELIPAKAADAFVENDTIFARDTIVENNTIVENPKRELITATVCWLILISLTVLAVVLDQLSLDRYLLLTLVFVITFIKGKVVVDIFMGLITAPKLWRRLLTSYVFVVPMVTGLLYLLS